MACMDTASLFKGYTSNQYAPDERSGIKEVNKIDFFFFPHIIIIREIIICNVQK